MSLFGLNLAGSGWGLVVSLYDESNETCCSIYDGECVADMHAENLKMLFFQSESNPVPDIVALSVRYTERLSHP
jgi:hypothetical protein